MVDEDVRADNNQREVVAVRSAVASAVAAIHTELERLQVELDAAAKRAEGAE